MLEIVAATQVCRMCKDCFSVATVFVALHDIVVSPRQARRSVLVVAFRLKTWSLLCENISMIKRSQTHEAVMSI
jgi:hypothetical protein